MRHSDLIKRDFCDVDAMRKRLAVVERLAGRRVEEVNDALVVLVADGDGVGAHRYLGFIL